MEKHYVDTGDKPTESMQEPKKPRRSPRPTVYSGSLKIPVTPEMERRIKNLAERYGYSYAYTCRAMIEAGFKNVANRWRNRAARAAAKDDV